MTDSALLLGVAIGGVILVVAVVVARLGRRTIVYDYQRGLRYRNGRFQELVGPGSYWLLTKADVIRVVDIRSSILPVPGQELVTSDGITIKVSLAVQRRTVDPIVATNEIENYATATYSLLQVALREVIAGMTIGEFMAGRTGIGDEVLSRTKDAVLRFGVELESVDVKDVMLPAPTKRLLSQVVEARQRGLATLEKTRAETAALRSLANAARLVDEHPAILQLRLLEQLESTSGNTVVVGLPVSTAPLPVKPRGANPARNVDDSEKA